MKHTKAFTIFECIFCIALLTMLLPVVLLQSNYTPRFSVFEHMVKSKNQEYIDMYKVVDEIHKTAIVGQMELQSPYTGVIRLESTSKEIVNDISDPQYVEDAILRGNECRLRPHNDYSGNNLPLRLLKKNNFQAGQQVTQIEFFGDRLIVSFDSGRQQNVDLAIYDAYSLELLDEIDIGLGVHDFIIDQHIIYVAQDSNTQIIVRVPIKEDISGFDRSTFNTWQIDQTNYVDSLEVWNDFAVVHGLATSTNMIGFGIPHSIQIEDNILILGTTKSIYPELLFFDIDDHFNLITTYERNSQVNEIQLYVDRVHQEKIVVIGGPEEKQIEFFYFDNIQQEQITIQPFHHITFSGSAVQDVTSIHIHYPHMYIARTVGGFNSNNNHEIFVLNIEHGITQASTTSSFDVGSSVNDVEFYGEVGILGIGQSKPKLSFMEHDLLRVFDEVATDTITSSIDCLGEIIAVGAKSNGGATASISIYSYEYPNI